MSTFIQAAVISATIATLPPTPGAVTAYGPYNTPTRWSGQPPVAGYTIACPPAWRGDYIILRGVKGVWRCEDTPRDAYWPAGLCDAPVCVVAEGLPHLDANVGSVAKAKRWGVRVMWFWRIEGGDW